MSESEDVSQPARVAELADELPEVTGRERMTRALGLALLLIIATILAYQQVWQAGFVWKDDFAVSANPLLTAPDGLKLVWLHPFATFSPIAFTILWFEHAIWGAHAAGYHWFNLALHLLNALLLWRLLRALELPGAWLAAAFFALHPVEAESVAWITQQREVLMGFFFILTLLTWLKFVAGKRRGELKFYFLALLCFLLALGCDATACMLPIVVLLISWWKRGSVPLSRIAQVIPFAVLGGIVAGASWWQARMRLGDAARVATPFGERVIVAARDFWFYLAKLVWPTSAPFHYQRWNISQTNPLDYIWVGALVLVVVLLVIASRWIGRGAATALIFFAAIFEPMLDLVVLWTLRFPFLADHYPYLASIGPLALVAAGLTSASNSAPRVKAIVLPIIATCLLAALAFGSWQRAGSYTTDESLIREVVASYPLRWLAHYDLANSYLLRGKVDDAIPQFEAAMKANPRNITLRNEVGEELVRLGRTADAAAQFQAVLAIDPNSAVANNQVAIALLLEGKLDEARAHAEKSVASDPNDAAAQTNLAIILWRAGARDQAIPHFEKALEIDPHNAQAHFNFGNSLRQAGDMTGAIAHYRSAVENAPDYVAARMNLGNALLETGEIDSAAAEYEKLIAQHPDFAPAHGNLAAALNRLGRYSEAAEQMRTAARLQAEAQPTNP